MKMDNKKYLTKYLEKAKMFSNIALLSILKGGTTRHKLTGVFCAFLLINFGFACPINLRVNSLSGCKDMGIAKPINITVSTPVWSVNAPTAFEVDSNGKAEPFLFSAKRTNFTVMLSTEKECSNGITTPHKTRTPTKRVSDYHPFNSAQEFRSFYRAVAEQESDLKNETWSFLIHKNLYQEYMAWRKANRTKLILAGIIKGIKVG